MSRARMRLAWLTGALVSLLAPPQMLQAQQEVDPQQQIESAISRCMIRDGTAPAGERLNCWELVTTWAPNDARVIEGIRLAKQGIQEEEKAKLQQAEAKSKGARDSVEFLLARANQDLVNGSVDGADMYVTQVLEIDPRNIEARALRDRVSSARKWQARKNLAIALGVAVMAFAIGFAAFSKKIKEWRGQSGAKSEADTSAPVKSGGRIALRVVDGIGRGRMYGISGDTFRIGAAESDREEERNDLLINDSESRISRFHCALLRRKKKWTIVDSSVHGTWVNDARIERGATVPIRDGDEIVIAGVTRMVFTSL